jgi:prepilin-type N-terminal cleavage/methylation domain-containing protein
MSGCDRLLLKHSHPQRGFSLVELLVALVFVSILMAGMLTVFRSNASFTATQVETMGLQRRARSGLLQLQDDLMMAGYYFPPVLQSLGGQDPLIIENPGTTLTYKDSAGNDVTLQPDDVQIFMDVPLGVEGTINTQTSPGDTALSVAVASGAGLLQTGDIAWVQDTAPWEHFSINAPSGSGTVSLGINNAAALTDAFGNDVASGQANPIVKNVHLKGAPVMFLRPHQVIQYTIQLVALDPGVSTANTPCLVRQMKPQGATAWSSTEIIMEGVTGFVLDWSIDGGATWIRAGNGYPTAWSTIKTLTSTAFATSSSPVTQQLPGGLSSTVDPIWFNYVPVTFKVELETKSQIKRTEYAKTANAADYRTRRETLLISLRNSSLGAP